MYLVVDSAVIGLCLRPPAMQELPLGESTWLASSSSSSSFPYAISASKNLKNKWCSMRISKNCFLERQPAKNYQTWQKEKLFCTKITDTRMYLDVFFEIPRAVLIRLICFSLSRLSLGHHHQHHYHHCHQRHPPIIIHQHIIIMFCTWNSHTAHLFSPVTAFSRSDPPAPLLVLSHQF